MDARTIHNDEEWKMAQTSAVTSHFERGRDPEWRADDLDAHYREVQLKAIVGIEIDVMSIEGKAKLSQNRPDVDRRSVREHFVKGSLAERNVAQRMDPRARLTATSTRAFSSVVAIESQFDLSREAPEPTHSSHSTIFLLLQCTRVRFSRRRTAPFIQGGNNE